MESDKHVDSKCQVLLITIIFRLIIEQYTIILRKLMAGVILSRNIVCESEHGCQNEITYSES